MLKSSVLVKSHTCQFSKKGTPAEIVSKDVNYVLIRPFIQKSSQWLLPPQHTFRLLHLLGTFDAELYTENFISNKEILFSKS